MPGPEFDTNYLYALLAFLIGLLAGFRGIYERFPQNSIKAAFTLSGLIYLVTRGALPALIYCVLYYKQVIVANLLPQAIGIGLGAEAFMRSKFLIIEAKDGAPELAKGPLDLLLFYQNFFLKQIALKFSGENITLIETTFADPVSFPDLCEKIITTAEAYDAELKNNIINAVTELKNGYETKKADPAQNTGNLDKMSARLLGYRIIEIAGPDIFRKLTK